MMHTIIGFPVWFLLVMAIGTTALIVGVIAYEKGWRDRKRAELLRGYSNKPNPPPRKI